MSFLRLKNNFEIIQEIETLNFRFPLFFDMLLTMLRKDIKEFLKTIPKEITLVVASKYIGAEDILKLKNLGINNFGENRVDSFLQKYSLLEKENIKWHFIGHLQRNKALKVINKIDCLHSLDSLELAKLINKNRKTPLPCFVEVSINEEESKNGIKVESIESFVEQVLKLDNIQVVGFMMMSIKFSDEFSLNNQFKKLVDLRDHLEMLFNRKFPFLSMGMSEDYLIALKNKATHIRLGRILFR